MSKTTKKTLEEREKTEEMLWKIHSLDIGDADKETLEKLAKEEERLLKALGYEPVSEEIMRE